MPASKSLTQHVRDRSYRSRRHHELLLGPVVPWPELAAIQGRYAATEHELERRAIGVDFERAMRELAAVEEMDAQAEELERILNAPPTPYDPEANRRASERFARALDAEWRRRDGWTLTAIAEKLGVSPATVRRDLAHLETWHNPPADQPADAADSLPLGRR